MSFIDKDDKIQTVFIHRSGAMSAMVFGYNGLPKEFMENESKMRTYFDTEFKKYGITQYTLQKLNYP